MDEKKQIKISLGTIICIFIIVILIIIIGSMYFYYNYTLNENKLSNENQNNAVNSIDNSNDLVTYDITKAKYRCEIYIDHFLDQVANLTFYPNKTFEASIGNYNYPGMDVCDVYHCSGTYEIKGNAITCLLKEATREGEDKHTQNIEFVLEYNKNENTMRLISISDNKIQVYSFADKNSTEEIQLTVLKENNIFKEYIEDQVKSDSNEEQYFPDPAYYALNGNEDDANILVWRKICKYF